MIYDKRIPRETLLDYSKITNAIVTYKKIEINNDEVIRVLWKSGSYCDVGVACGRILSWKSVDNILVSHPVECCFFRAPTDNDKGGHILSYEAQWKAAGLDSLARHEESVGLVSCDNMLDGSVVVIAEWILRPMCKVPLPVEITCFVRYIFCPDDGIQVGMQFRLGSRIWAPYLPRIGVRFAIPSKLSNVSWFGLGPHEAYDDRKTCVRLGYFDSSVTNLHTPYVRPQECGRRAEPRYVF
jgi:beta-galactosidase